MVCNVVSGSWCSRKNSGVTSDKLGKRFPVFGDNGRIPKIFEIGSTKETYEYRPLVESDDFRKRGMPVDASQDRVTVEEAYDSFGFKSCWQFNHEPDLDLVENDCEKGCITIKTGKLCENIMQAKMF